MNCGIKDSFGIWAAESHAFGKILGEEEPLEIPEFDPLLLVKAIIAAGR